VRIVVTVDTEADGQWQPGLPLTTANVAAWSPFQEVCRRHGARPTYLITSEIAEDPAAATFLRPLAVAGELEVGAHLHPWTTPPFADVPGLRRNDRDHAFPCQLEPELLLAKLETLTAQVARVAGARPTSYRAGRFGLDAIGAYLVAELGYEVDSSVTPFATWTARPGRPGYGGGPDFRRHDARPFRVAGSGTPGLVEVPVTIMPTYAITRRAPWLREHWQARPVRFARRALGMWPRPQPLWLRPWLEYTLGDLQALVLEAERAHLPCAVVMFHSSELLAGASPYRRSPGEVDVLLGLLNDLFAWMSGRGHDFATLSHTARAVAADGRLPVREL
jgi:hypothetical protein